MKKIAVAAMAVLVTVSGVFANDFFFPADKSMVLISANVKPKSLNAKKLKIKDFTRTTIKDVENIGDTLVITYVLETLNKKLKVDRNSVPFTYRVKIIDGTLVMDAASFMSVPAEVGGAITISGDMPRLPANISAGQRFNDTNFDIITDFDVMKQTTNIAITDYKCLAVESVTVPAGTFEAYKITQTITATMTFIVRATETSVNETWNVKGIGPVKTIIYNEKGKAKLASVLYEVKR
ncbi:MAG: hypothetical protein FWB94_11400 [Chitinispirillia bacterium]|nr:hypothetical protein [Chitinispirillia bacterium]